MVMKSKLNFKGADNIVFIEGMSYNFAQYIGENIAVEPAQFYLRGLMSGKMYTVKTKFDRIMKFPLSQPTIGHN